MPSCYIRRNARDIVYVYTGIYNSYSNSVLLLTILKFLNAPYFYYYTGVISMWEGGGIGEGRMSTNRVKPGSLND